MDMKKTGKFVIVIFFLMLVSGIFCACSEKQKSEPSQLTILYTNDVHCGYNENMGYAGLKTYKDMMKKDNKYENITNQFWKK